MSVAASPALAPARYHPALDGLRAVAVIAVVLFHAGATSSLPGLAPGGFIGVSVFFTLSGYLVTSLLLRQVLSPDGLDFGRFWARRLKRLAPASLLVVLVTVLLAPTFYPGMRASDAIAGVFGYTNWHVIWSGPDALLRTIVGPLGPFWSLAIEEQFYLVASITIVLAARSARPVRTVGIVVAVGWLLSAVLQLVARWPQYRLEFGTDMKASELLAGCALGVLLTVHPDLPRRFAHVLRPTGIVALAIVVVLAATTDYDPPWLLHGGYAALSLVSTVLVMALLEPGPLTRALSWAPAVRIGQLSYSWYVVHWPIILIVSSDRLGFDSWGLVVVKVGVSLVVAFVLHHLIEQPLRRAAVPDRLAVATWAVASLAVVAVAVIVL